MLILGLVSSMMPPKKLQTSGRVTFPKDCRGRASRTFGADVAMEARIF